MSVIHIIYIYIRSEENKLLKTEYLNQYYLVCMPTKHGNLKDKPYLFDLQTFLFLREHGEFVFFYSPKKTAFLLEKPFLAEPYKAVLGMGIPLHKPYIQLI